MSKPPRNFTKPKDSSDPSHRFATEPDRTRLSPAALSAFRRLSEAWRLTRNEIAELLSVSPNTWEKIHAGTWQHQLNQDQLTRISALVGIYEGLRAHFDDQEADRWPRLQNKEPLFRDLSPVNAMRSGGIPTMLEVRRYVDRKRPLAIDRRQSLNVDQKRPLPVSSLPLPAITLEIEDPDFPFPLIHLSHQRTIRLISTARLRDPVLLALVDVDDLDALAEIEGATSARPKTYGGARIGPKEFAAGPAHANFINAAFAYWRPRELNRFNGPGRGAWYAALELETCIAEVKYHLVRELERVNDFNATVEYAELYADFSGVFIDLRSTASRLLALDPDPKVGYPAGNALADIVRARSLDGVIYPSTRHEGGTYLVALNPKAVHEVNQGRGVRLSWRGTKEAEVTYL